MPGHQGSFSEQWQLWSVMVSVGHGFSLRIINYLKRSCGWVVLRLETIKGQMTHLCCCCCCLVLKPSPTLCYPMDCSTLGFPVLHCLLEFAETHVHWVSDAIQSFHPLSPPSCFDFSISQHQRLFKWVSFLHQVAKVLEFQLEDQSFQDCTWVQSWVLTTWL